MKLWLYKSQNNETSLILLTTNYLHHDQFNQFHISRKLEENTQYIITRHHILVKGLKSKIAAICIATFDFIVSLDMPCWQLRSLALSNSPTIISWSYTLWVLPKQKINLITWRCLTNVASHFDYIQYWGYTPQEHPWHLIQALKPKFLQPLSKQTKPWVLTTYMEVNFFFKELEKQIGGKGLKGDKVARLTLAFGSSPMIQQ